MRVKLIHEFKEFAVKGNMIDIAIGVIIGAAFNKVVDVLVKEIFLPPLSFLTNGVNLENKRLILRHPVTEAGITHPEEIAIGYGKLIEASVDYRIYRLSYGQVDELDQKKSGRPRRRQGCDPKGYRTAKQDDYADGKTNTIARGK